MAPGFFARPAEVVARDLLGCVLFSAIDGVRTSGRIVETEAYIGPHDPASHAAERIGRTVRNQAMYGPPGMAYVYRSYGVHWCLNAVTDRQDYPAAVLIRALEPQEGLETMRARRWGSGRVAPDRELCRGPGRLTAALAITGALAGHPLARMPLWIEPGAGLSAADVACGPRIGIAQAADWPLRFWQRGSPWVSR
ncbi:MAG: DNA-3-methyladenine glycosylase [Gemmatimonadetes bacterium]|nr:DNA-3-methyladenine glycosylase [Gemmatimonadota bacterium]